MALISNFVVCSLDYKNLNEFVDRIDHSVPRVTTWQTVTGGTELSILSTNALDSFSCILLGASDLINPFIP